MGKKKEAEALVRKSYELLALLSVCELAAWAMRPDHAGADAGNIGAAIGLAHRLAGEIPDELEAGEEV